MVDIHIQIADLGLIKMTGRRLQIRRGRRPTVASGSEWHSETSSGITNRTAIKWKNIRPKVPMCAFTMTICTKC